MKEFAPLKDRYREIKTQVRILLHDRAGHNKKAILVQLFIGVVILLNTMAVILFTVKDIQEQYSQILMGISNFCMYVFVIEYFLRIWSCTDETNPRKMITKRIRYALQFYLIIDLVTILPVLLPFFFPYHLTLVRSLRLISIFKLGRFFRNNESLSLLRKVLIRKREIFAIMIFFLIFVILFSSTIMYFLEYSAQPEVFSSIPEAMWWAVMTVTTVGYGDIIPVTPLGKLVAGIITLTGVLILALPSAILAAGFMEEREHRKKDPESLDDWQVKLALISRLAEMRDKNQLTEEEYASLKSHLTRIRK